MTGTEDDKFNLDMGGDEEPALELDLPEPPKPERPMPPPPSSEPLELDRPEPPPPAPAAPPAKPSAPRPSAPRPSAPGGVRSAMRAEPLPKEKRLTKEALREGATDVLLNSVSILREVVADFKSSDKFFKYKALVLSVWVMTFFTSIGVSCSGHSTGNSFGARLVIAGDAVDRIYMIKNDSTDEWQSVTVTVNGKYSITAAQLRSYGDISLSPRLMFDENGKEAPPNTVISEIAINCSEGDTVLLKGGKPP